MFQALKLISVQISVVNRLLRGFYILPWLVW